MKIALARALTDKLEFLKEERRLERTDIFTAFYCGIIMFQHVFITVRVDKDTRQIVRSGVQLLLCYMSYRTSNPLDNECKGGHCLSAIPPHTPSTLQAIFFYKCDTNITNTVTECFICWLLSFRCMNLLFTSVFLQQSIPTAYLTMCNIRNGSLKPWLMVNCTLEGTESLAEGFLNTYFVISDRVFSLIFLNEKSYYLKITK